MELHSEETEYEILIKQVKKDVSEQESVKAETDQKLLETILQKLMYKPLHRIQKIITNIQNYLLNVRLDPWSGAYAVQAFWDAYN